MKKIIDYINQLNNKIAIMITNYVGTMWCAYIFSIMVFIPFIYPDTRTLITFVSSSLLQLILLPVIIVGQSIQGSTSEIRAKKDHKMIREELQMIRDEMTLIKEIHSKITLQNKDDEKESS